MTDDLFPQCCKHTNYRSLCMDCLNEWTHYWWESGQREAFLLMFPGQNGMKSNR